MSLLSKEDTTVLYTNILVQVAPTFPHCKLEHVKRAIARMSDRNEGTREERALLVFWVLSARKTSNWNYTEFWQLLKDMLPEDEPEPTIANYWTLPPSVQAQVLSEIGEK